MVSSVEAQTPEEEWEPRRWLEDLGGHHEAPYQGLFQRAWERMQDNALLLSGDPEAYIRRRCGTVEILDRILGMDGETLTAALLDEPRGDIGRTFDIITIVFPLDIGESKGQAS